MNGGWARRGTPARDDGTVGGWGGQILVRKSLF